MSRNLTFLFAIVLCYFSSLAKSQTYTFPSDWTCPSTGFLSCQPGHSSPVIDGQGSLLTASLSNCVFFNCPSITITNGSVLTLNNVTFSSNNTFSNYTNYNYRGSLAFVDGGSGVLNNVVFNGLIADYGSAISVYYGSQVTVNNGLFVRLRAKGGGVGISILESNLNCTDCFFTNGTGQFGAIDALNSTVYWTRGYCRFMRVYSGACFQGLEGTRGYITNVTMAYNYASNRASAMAFSTGSYGRISRVLCESNVVNYYYADLVVTWYSWVEVYDSYFNNSMAGDMAGSFGLNFYSSLDVFRTTFRNNYAGGTGGLAQLWWVCTLYLEDSYLIGGATDDSGGMLWVETYSSVLAYNTVIGGGYSLYGGAIYGGYGTNVTLVGSYLAYNYVDGYGGAVFLENGALELHDGTTFEANAAGYEGGGVFAYQGSYVYAGSSKIDAPVVFSNDNTAGGAGSNMALWSVTMAEFGNYVNYYSLPDNDAYGSNIAFHQYDGYVLFNGEVSKVIFEGSLNVIQPSLIEALRDFFVNTSTTINTIPTKTKFNRQVCLYQDGSNKPFSVSIYNALDELVTPEQSKLPSTTISLKLTAPQEQDIKEESCSNGYSNVTYDGSVLSSSVNLQNYKDAQLEAGILESYPDEQGWGNSTIGFCFELKFTKYTTTKVEVSLEDGMEAAINPENVLYEYFTVDLISPDDALNEPLSLTIEAGSNSVEFSGLTFKKGISSATLQASIAELPEPEGGWPTVTIALGNGGNNGGNVVVVSGTTLTVTTSRSRPTATDAAFANPIDSASLPATFLASLFAFFLA